MLGLLCLRALDVRVILPRLVGVWLDHRLPHLLGLRLLREHCVKLILAPTAEMATDLFTKPQDDVTFTIRSLSTVTR